MAGLRALAWAKTGQYVDSASEVQRLIRRGKLPNVYQADSASALSEELSDLAKTAGLPPVAVVVPTPGKAKVRISADPRSAQIVGTLLRLKLRADWTRDGWFAPAGTIFRRAPDGWVVE